MNDSEAADTIAIYGAAGVASTFGLLMAHGATPGYLNPLGAAFAVISVGSWLGFVGLFCCVMLDWLTPDDKWRQVDG